MSSWWCRLQGPGLRNLTSDVYRWFNDKDEFKRKQIIIIITIIVIIMIIITKSVSHHKRMQNNNP